jgi:hypothetical protein
MTVSSDPGGISVGVQSNGGVAITDIARRLDFVVPSRTLVSELAGCVSILMIMTGMFGVITVISSDHNAKIGWLWLLFFLSGLVIFVCALRTRHRIIANLDIPTARAVWQSGWFCHRCGGVFFPVGTPHTVPTGRLLSPEEFQRVVHNAGRFHG